MTLIDHVDVRGGAERVAHDVAIALDPERFERHFCASRSPAEGSDRVVDAAIAELRSAGVRYHSLGRRRKVDVWRWAPFVALLRRARIDVLHAHKFGSNAWGSVTGRLAGVPVVISHEHTWPYVGRPVRQLLDRELIARFSDAFVAVSRSDQRKMTEVEGIPAERTVYIPNGVRIPEHAGPRRGRELLGLAPDTPTVGSVGFLHRRKRFDLLVQAAARVRTRFPDVRVFIAGEGDERGDLEQLIATLGLERTVTLLGRRTDVSELLGAFDVAVCCSDHEGAPISVLEYMEAGLPVVGTRVGGTPDMIDDGHEGLVIEPGDAEALAAAIERLLGDPAEAARMGAAGRERRRRDFTIEAMCERLQQLYLDRLRVAGREAD